MLFVFGFNNKIFNNIINNNNIDNKVDELVAKAASLLLADLAADPVCSLDSMQMPGPVANQSNEPGSQHSFLSAADKNAAANAMPGRAGVAAPAQAQSGGFVSRMFKKKDIATGPPPDALASLTPEQQRIVSTRVILHPEIPPTYSSSLLPKNTA